MGRAHDSRLPREGVEGESMKEAFLAVLDDLLLAAYQEKSMKKMRFKVRLAIQIIEGKILKEDRFKKNERA